MSVEQNKQIITEWYNALATMDQEKFLGLHTDDVIYNIHAKIPLSGRWLGKQTFMDDVMPLIFGSC